MKALPASIATVIVTQKNDSEPTWQINRWINLLTSIFHDLHPPKLYNHRSITNFLRNYYLLIFNLFIHLGSLRYVEGIYMGSNHIPVSHGTNDPISLMLKLHNTQLDLLIFNWYWNLYINDTYQFIHELQLRNSTVNISTANGQPIKFYEETTIIIITANLRREFLWTFVITEVTQPILSADLLSHYNLLVDCKAGVSKFKMPKLPIKLA